MRFLLSITCVVCIALQCGAQLETFDEIVLTQEVRGPKWGDVSGQYFYEERVAKWRIPFFTRCATIVYPQVGSNERSGASAKTPPSLRGLEHANLVDKPDTGCADPDIELKEGGPYASGAKIKICSKRGCPLDSKIYFFQLK